MMTVEKEELGLSLSLTSFSQHHQQRSHPSPKNPHNHKLPRIDAFSPFGHRRNSESCHNSGAPLFLCGIKVNRSPNIGCHPGDEEEEHGVSSPNSTLSSVSGKRSEREIDHAVEETERASSRGISDEEDGENSRKKLRLSKDQSAVLEESFMEHNTLNPKQKLALAKQLGLRPRQVEVWFQNRRARTKLKQTEIDCEFLKRCCENLTEENRRLHKEVQELRAIKLSPQFYMQMNPPTTLTMCLTCERVGVPPSASSALNTARPIAMTSGHHRHMDGNQWAHTGPFARAAALQPGP